MDSAVTMAFDGLAATYLFLRFLLYLTQDVREPQNPYRDGHVAEAWKSMMIFSFALKTCSYAVLSDVKC